MNNMNVLVVGTGMYVCGRGTKGYGTIMPALFEWMKDNSLGTIYIAGKSSEGIKKAKAKINKLSHDMGIDRPAIYFFDDKNKSQKSYVKALKEIPKPACAIVVVPDNLHLEIASATIKAGLHTLCVKPLTPTVKEGEKLIALQKKSKVYCACEFHKRLDVANIKLKDSLSKKRIGDPLYFVVEYSQRKSIPHRHFKKWVKDTNVFQYLGVHYVDLIYFVTGARPLRAMAIGQKGWLSSKGMATYDSIEGIIEWKMLGGGKFVSHILTNWVDPESTSAMSYQKIKVIGTKGRFESDQKRRGITIVTDRDGIKEPNPYFCSAYGQTGEVSYRGYGIESIHQFLDDVNMIENRKLRIKDLENKRPIFKQAILSTAVVEAVNKSLEQNGEWVDIRGV